MKEPRCLVCGACLDRGAPFQVSKGIRTTECCSDECYKIYMTDDDGVCHAEDKEL